MKWSSWDVSRSWGRNIIKKETPGIFLAPFAMGDYREKMAMRKPALNKHPVFQHLDLGSTYFQNGKKNFLLSAIHSMVFSYSCRYELRQGINLQLDDKQWTWEDGWKVKRTYISCRRTVVQSPAPRAGQSQSPATPSPGDSVPSSDRHRRTHAHTTPTTHIMYTCAHPHPPTLHTHHVHVCTPTSPAHILYMKIHFKK